MLTGSGNQNNSKEIKRSFEETQIDLATFCPKTKSKQFQRNQDKLWSNSNWPRASLISAEIFNHFQPHETAFNIQVVVYYVPSGLVAVFLWSNSATDYNILPLTGLNASGGLYNIQCIYRLKCSKAKVDGWDGIGSLNASLLWAHWC